MSKLIGFTVASLAIVGISGCADSQDFTGVSPTEQYVNDVNDNVPIVGDNMTNDEIIDTGNEMCSDIKDIGVKQYISNVSMAFVNGDAPNGMTPEDAGAFIGITVKHLCPEVKDGI